MGRIRKKSYAAHPSARSHYVRWTVYHLHKKKLQNEKLRILLEDHSKSQKGITKRKMGIKKTISSIKEQLKYSETSHLLVPSSSTVSCQHKSHRKNWLDSRHYSSLSSSLMLGGRKLYLAVLLSIVVSGLLEANWTTDRAVSSVDAALIIGDSAIEIQEVDGSSGSATGDGGGGGSGGSSLSNSLESSRQLELIEQKTAPPSTAEQQHQILQNGIDEQPSIILGSTATGVGLDGGSIQLGEQAGEPLAIQQTLLNQASQTMAPIQKVNSRNQYQQLRSHIQMPAPLPPLDASRPATSPGRPAEPDITDGDENSRSNHDYYINDLVAPTDDKQEQQSLERTELSRVLSARPEAGGRVAQSEAGDNSKQLGDKSIAGKVVDFELQSAGGHNKAKIKKKKKKKKKKEEEMFKKWDKKKKAEKKHMEKEHKEEMKKKKEEGKKGKKKWGHEEHGQKKKGNFKKKKWGKKIKKGKGIKKGKKGKKFLLDKGHKNTGFKTVYHKEEWGKSNKWHDIKREKKWDEKSKKWKKKWKKEKGKKYKGDHMKKFENKKKSGKKYKKEHKDKFKKSKKEEFEKGKKNKMEEHKKKKENGAKKEMKEMKKKKKKKGG